MTNATFTPVPDFLNKITVKVGRYVRLARAERELRGLDDRMLADIGLGRSEIHYMVWSRR